MNTAIETRSWREYQRQRQIHKLKKKCAWIGVTMFGALILFALGSSFVLCPVRIYTAIAIALVVAYGFWSAFFLMTRH